MSFETSTSAGLDEEWSQESWSEAGVILVKWTGQPMNITFSQKSKEKPIIMANGLYDVQIMLYITGKGLC